MSDLWVLLTALCVALAAALTSGRPARSVFDPQRSTSTRREVQPAPSPRLAIALTGIVAAGAAAGGLRGTHVMVVGIGLAAALVGLRLAGRAARVRAATARRHQVIDFCEALVGELQAGQPLRKALQRSVAVWPESQSLTVAAAMDANVPEALRRLARLPGASGVGRLAAAWEICAATGAGLAFAAEQVLQTARAEAASALSVQAELASARATARLVSVLPLVVLVAADGIGARPWQFLFATIPGVVCLALGVGLALAGLAWIDRIAAGAAGER